MPPLGLGGLKQRIGAVTPKSILGTALKAWFRSDLGITAPSGNVSLWADQSGNGNDLTQATVGVRPVYNASGGGNNRPYLAVNADRFLANTTLPVLAHPWVLLAVFRSTTASPVGTAALASMNADTPTCEMYQAVGTASMRQYNGAEANATTISVNVDHRISYVWNNASSSITVDAGSTATGDPGSPTDTTATGFSVFARSTLGSGSWVGWGYEFLIVNRALTGSENVNIATYFQHLYGVA
jgi:hypothetical protein